VALIKSRSGISPRCVPFISGYHSTSTRNQSCCLRFECQRLCVARFVGINVFYSHAASRRACSRRWIFHRQSNVQVVRGPFNLVSPSTVTCDHPLLLRATCSRYMQLNTCMYMCVIRRKNQRSPFESILDSKKSEKCMEKRIGSSRTLLLDFSLENFLHKLDARCATQLLRVNLLATYKL